MRLCNKRDCRIYYSLLMLGSQGSKSSLSLFLVFGARIELKGKGSSSLFGLEEKHSCLQQVSSSAAATERS